MSVKAAMNPAHSQTIADFSKRTSWWNYCCNPHVGGAESSTTTSAGLRTLEGSDNEGPTATAGGWEYIVQVPWVVVLLSVAFGVGFYLVVSWVARHR